MHFNCTVPPCPTSEGSRSGWDLPQPLRHGLCAILLLIASTPGLGAAQDSNAVFEASKLSLFVVESVDRISQNKNSVGSGFAVSDDALLATNYHVVADAILEPEDYRLRIVSIDGRTSTAEVIAADPVHDLAVLRVDAFEDNDAAPSTMHKLPLATADPVMGEELLALGNPLDVGLSVVPGVYNGQLEKHFRPLIHFTGALNPGMSGGPTVNMRGEVVGINVAGAGNSVGFLVPVAQLQKLLERVAMGSHQQPREQFAAQLRQHHDALIDDLIAGDWTTEEFGPLRIPKEVRGYVNCRGSAEVEDEERRWVRGISDCRVDDRIYLSDRLDTGPVEMQFILLESDRLNPMQFAELFSGESFQPVNRGNEDHLTHFDCVERWTQLPQLGEQAFKASYCTRAYLDFPDLYDVLYVARGMPHSHQGLSIHYTLAGVGRDAANRFHKHFLEATQWN